MLALALVLLQGRVEPELEAAGVTRERLFAGVRSEVRLELGLGEESLTALAALEPLLARVDLFVAEAVLLEGEAFAAEAAQLRLEQLRIVDQVASLVLLAAVARRELFAAVGAQEGLEPDVDVPLVRLEPREGLATNVALEGMGLQVNLFLVNDHGRVSVEHLVANRAGPPRDVGLPRLSLL